MPNIYAVLNSGSVVVEFWTWQVTHDELLAHERTREHGVRHRD